MPAVVPPSGHQLGPDFKSEPWFGCDLWLLPIPTPTTTSPARPEAAAAAVAPDHCAASRPCPQPQILVANHSMITIRVHTSKFLPVVYIIL
jgi:hypothetical protein